jgi:ABC-type polysaccharide/polyol phosphate export permease
VRALVLASRDVWEWRHLVKALTLYSIKQDNRNTVMGNLWHLLNPLMNMLIFMFVFTVIFRRDRPDYPVFFFIGSMFLRLWTTSIAQGTRGLTRHGALIKSNYFPRVVVLVPMLLMNLYSFVVEMFVLFGLMLLFRVRPGWELVLVPLLAIVTTVGNGGVVMMMSCLGARFRDLTNVMAHLNRLLFYFSPVMYPITFVPERFRHLYLLNPVAASIEMGRDLFMRAQAPPLHLAAYYTAFCITVFFIGLAVFSRMQERVVKYL